MKPLSLVLVLFLFSGASSKLDVIGFSTYQRLQIKNDFDILNNLFELMTGKETEPMVLEKCKFNGCGIAKKKRGVYFLKSEANRGNWVHELAHAFQNQTDNKEFVFEALEHFTNGYSPEMVKREIVQ